MVPIMKELPACAPNQAHARRCRHGRAYRGFLISADRRRNTDVENIESDPEIARVLHLARQHLEMDVAFVSQFTRGKQIFQAADGDAESFGIELDDGPLIEGTYCRMLVRGTIPPVIGQTAANPHVAHLDATRDSRIGAYVGVPLTFSDGEVYGTFCCLSHEPDAGLNQRDGRFMAMLADILAIRVEHIVARQRRRARLVEATEHRDFAIALQPIVSLTSGDLVGAEALARFTGGLGAPDVVFGEAHDLGVGPRMEAASFQASRHLKHLLPDGAYLAMNLSPAALLDPAMHAPLREVNDPSKCVLELTEHVSVDGYAPLLEALEPLRARGFRVAVDDVGAGYASFNHVLELNPDILKIDRSLVAGSSRDGARRRIITSIVLLALDLGATVVAEGIEDHDDLLAVTDLGVDAVQGYLLAKPTVDHDEVDGWVSGWHLGTSPKQRAQVERRDAFGQALRDLRGSRRQVDVLRDVNKQLETAGEGARVSQGQYSAYEHGREWPKPVRLRAIETVFGLEHGALAWMLGGIDAADQPTPSTISGAKSLAARIGEARNASRSEVG